MSASNLFYNETVDGKNDLTYTLTRPNIGSKCKLVFRAFEGNKDGSQIYDRWRRYEEFSVSQRSFSLAIFLGLALLTFL